MTDFLNVNKEILSETKRNAQNPNASNSSYFGVSEGLGTIDPLAFENIDQYGKRPPVTDLTYEELYPTQQGPVTQQGFSGYGISIPTIAAGYSAFPFEALEKRKAAELQQRQKETARISQTPETLHLQDPTADPNWLRAVAEMEQDWYNEAVTESKNISGTGVHARELLAGSTNYKNYREQLKATKKGFDNAYAVVTAFNTIDTDKPAYRSPELINLGNQYYESASKWASDPTNRDYMNNLSKIGNKLQKQVDVHKSIKTWADNVNPSVRGIPYTITDPSGDFKELRTVTVTGSYFKIDPTTNEFELTEDANGNVTPVFDEDKFDNDFNSNYEATYGDGEFGPDKAKMKEQYRSALGENHKLEINRATQATENLWKWEHKKNFEKEQEEEAIETGVTYLPIGSGTPEGNTDVIYNESFSLPSGTKVNLSEGVWVRNKSTGEVVKVNQPITMETGVFGNTRSVYDQFGNFKGSVDKNGMWNGKDFKKWEKHGYIIKDERMVTGRIVTDEGKENTIKITNVIDIDLETGKPLKQKKTTTEEVDASQFTVITPADNGSETYITLTGNKALGKKFANTIKQTEIDKAKRLKEEFPEQPTKEEDPENLF